MTALLHLLDARPDFSELDDDGDTVEFLGRTYRLRIEPDDLTIEDIGSDWYGRIEWLGRPNDYGYHDRPRDMDGNAEILSWGPSYERAWWQPPKDVPRGTEGFTKLRSALADLLTYGYSSFGLEELVGVDAYNRPVVARAAWVGGVEPFPDDDDKREIISELYAELTP